MKIKQIQEAVYAQFPYSYTTLNNIAIRMVRELEEELTQEAIDYACGEMKEDSPDCWYDGLYLDSISFTKKSYGVWKVKIQVEDILGNGPFPILETSILFNKIPEFLKNVYIDGFEKEEQICKDHYRAVFSFEDHDNLGSQFMALNERDDIFNPFDMISLCDGDVILTTSIPIRKFE